MTAKTFVDSNILIYAHDFEAGSKQQRAAERLAELWDEHIGRLSTQVLQDFYVNVTRKIKVPLSRSAAREVIRNYTLGSTHGSPHPLWFGLQRSVKYGICRFGTA